LGAATLQTAERSAGRSSKNREAIAEGRESSVDDMNTTDATKITAIDSITLEVADPEAASRFYADAFGLTSRQVRTRASDAPTSGFRGFAVSLVVSQPANVRALFHAAVARRAG